MGHLGARLPMSIATMLLLLLSRFLAGRAKGAGTWDALSGWIPGAPDSFCPR